MSEMNLDDYRYYLRYESVTSFWSGGIVFLNYNHTREFNGFHTLNDIKNAMCDYLIEEMKKLSELEQHIITGIPVSEVKKP